MNYNTITLSDNRKLCYREYGAAHHEVVICVHGLSRNSRDFIPLAEALSVRYRVICVDIAGRGESDWLSDKTLYHYGTYIADITQLVIQLGITTCKWVGTSMGGIMGMMIAACNPPFITKMVLNDVGSIVAKEGLQRILRYVGKNTDLFTDKATAMEYLKNTLAPFGIESEREWEFMFQASMSEDYRLRYDPDINQSFIASAQEKPITDIDLSETWNKITCPILLLRGENSDILSKETALKMREGRPNVTYKEYAGVGHAPALINQTQIRDISEWL